MNWIDVHTHIDMLETTPEETRQLCLANHVSRVINIGTGPEDNEKILQTTKSLGDFAYCTLGMHPHDAKDYNQEAEDFILNNIKDPKVVAVGEIGLDYFYNHSEHEVQRKVFHRTLEIASEHNLPIEIHTRDAEDDTLKILKDHPGVKGIVHCFSGTKDFALKSLDLGLDISFSGIITFKKADELRDVVKEVPLSRLHVETDAPFLAPMPHRGKKNNPSYVVHTAEKVAQIKEVSLEEVSRETLKNAKRVFSKIQF